MTFRCQIGESVPLLKRQQGLCFHHIMKVRASPFYSQNRLGNALRTGSALFHTFGSTFGAQVGPKGAQGSPKWSKRTPKASPGTPKIHQKSTWDPTWVLKGTRETPGVPPGRKMTPQSTTKQRTTASIPPCFLNIFGATIGGTVPQKRRAFRVVSYIFLM